MRQWERWRQEAAGCLFRSTSYATSLWLLPRRAQLKAQEYGEPCNSCSSDCSRQGTCFFSLFSCLFSATQATGQGDPRYVKYPLAVLPCLSFLLLWCDLLFCSQVALSCRQGPVSLISTRVYSSSSRSLQCKIQAAYSFKYRDTGYSRMPWSSSKLRIWLPSKLALQFFLNCASINYRTASTACQS